MPDKLYILTQFEIYGRHNASDSPESITTDDEMCLRTIDPQPPAFTDSSQRIVGYTENGPIDFWVAAQANPMSSRPKQSVLLMRPS